ANHLVRVLRLREGDACVLFNGDGHDYPARLASVGKREVAAEVLESHAVDNESPLRIVLLQGIARGEKMDLILQKATELGVAAIVPVNGERTEVKRTPSGRASAWPAGAAWWVLPASSPAARGCRHWRSRPHWMRRPRRCPKRRCACCWTRRANTAWRPWTCTVPTRWWWPLARRADGRRATARCCRPPASRACAWARGCCARRPPGWRRSPPCRRA